MAITESWFKQDLKKSVIQRYIDGNFFSLDNVGNLVGVKVYDNGAEAALSGSVTGYCVLADGTTVPVAGTRSGNQAYILLPQSVLSIPGYIGIVLKLTDGNTITTLLSIIATVYRSQTDTVITPSQQIITDWASQISAALQEVEDASAAQDEKIDSLKNALQPITGNGIIEMVRDHQLINSSNPVDINGMTARAGRNCAVVECSPGDVFTINGTSGTSLRLWAFLDASYRIIDPMAPSNAVGNNTEITAPANAKYLTLNDLSGAAVSYYGKLLSKTITEMQTQINTNTTDITQNTGDIAEITTDLTDITREIGLTNITGWQSGAISGGTSANIANAVASPAQSSVFEYVIVECSPGDVFTINANSGISPKAFYFTDSSYNVLTRGDKGSYTDYVIAAPETSNYLIINKNVSNTKNSYKGAIQNGLNITGVGSDNMVWSWATYPGIVSFNRVRNKVYWGYTTADGYRGIASYDFDTKETIKNNLFRGQIDDHNSTAVHVCPDGTIICGFSTGHNYDYCMHIRRSSVPECIERFDDDIIVAGIGETSYCQFASYGSRLYMFYRIGDTKWVHRLSTDNGVTWSAPTQIVSSAEKMYIKIVPTTTATRMRILLFNNSTYDDSEIRQGFFDLTNGNIYNSDNSTLLGTSGLSITDFTVLIPLDATLTHTRFFDAAVTAPGSPLIAYCVFDTGDDSEYRIFDSGNVTATFIGGYGLMNYYQLGMAWRGTNQIVVAHGVNADGGTDLIDLYDYANGTSTFNTNLDTVIRGSVPIRLARPIVDQAGKAVIWQRGYYNRSDYTDFNMDAKLHVFVD